MRKTLLPLFALCGAFIFQEESFAQSSYSMNIDISEQASVSLTNYQVDLTLNTEALILAGKMNVDGSDMRFYEDSCLSTPIDHWVESGINSTSTLVWVRVPSIPANTVTSIYMAYGDPSATDASNFAATFPNAIISAGSSINLTGNVIADWFQIDAGDTLSVVSGAPLTINSRKIIINHLGRRQC